MRVRRAVAFDKLTMEVVQEYPSITECAEAACMPRESMYSILRDRTLCPGRYCYRYADDFDPNESFEGKRNRPVKLTDVDTGRVYRCPSALDAARNLFLTRQWIAAAIRNGSLLCGQFRAEWLR